MLRGRGPYKALPTEYMHALYFGEGQGIIQGGVIRERDGASACSSVFGVLRNHVRPCALEF